jgi:hypothetical protein
VVVTKVPVDTGPSADDPGQESSDPPRNDRRSEVPERPEEVPVKKLFPILLMVLGVAFVAAGGYAVYRGFDAHDQVKDELAAQNITTPDDASIPNTLVDDPDTARSMAEIIEVHALESSGGLTYAEMGRFTSAADPEDPAGTSNPDEALIGENGQPVVNNARNTAFQASALRTSLYSSVMAFEVSTLVVGIGVLMLVLGFAVGGVGVALAGLALPRFAKKFHVEPVAAAH